MNKHIPAALLLLAALFTSSSALAEQPCVGSNASCSWTCTQDGQGNIVNYSVSCTYTEWCVGSDGSVGFGLCDVAPPDEDPVAVALQEFERIDESVDGGTCEVVPPIKKTPVK